MPGKMASIHESGKIENTIFNKNDSNEAIRKMRTEGVSYRAICKLFDISWRRAKRICADLDPAAEAKRLDRNRQTFEDQYNEIRSARERGEPLALIAEKFSITTQRVYQICRSRQHYHHKSDKHPTAPKRAKNGM